MDTLQPDEFPHMPLWAGWGKDDDQDTEDAWLINKQAKTDRFFREVEDEGDLEDDYNADSEP